MKRHPQPGSLGGGDEPTRRIASLAERLRGLSASGLHYSSEGYGRERWTSVQDVVLELFSVVTGETLEELGPLRETLLLHPTPFAAADAAIIDRDGRMLLIQRSDNGLWAMPGGASEVGETPAQTATREAFEETGVTCEATALAGVFDSRLCGSVTRHHLYHFLFICKPLEAPLEEPKHARESLDRGWFVESELPSNLDPGHVTRIPVAFAVWRSDRPAYFDRV
ncbi:MAG TPA: NUDIX hydrolase N-terminal domain-containing protein [Actinomycetota bacterium]|nr:NUDIX hydrolase N-terminal domain-containing protein [Actinomycetota bacterium]